jgi:uncharacterized protein (TIGR02231 family)
MRKLLVLTIPVLALSAVAMTFLARAEPKEKLAEPAADAPKTAVSRIAQVTVYQSNALVTREVEVPEGAGAMELIVTPLPPQAMSDSLYSEGTDGIRVLTTRFRSRPVKEDTREEVRKLENQMKEKREAAQKLQADIDAAKLNIAMLGKLENFTSVTSVSSTAKGELNGDTVITLSKYVMEQRAERSKAVVALQQQLDNNKEQQEFLARQLKDLAAGHSKVERDAVIVVDKKNAAAGKVRLNYLVDAASWKPQYKFRAGKNEKDPVQVEYLAGVSQQSGEDWNNVDLILSTAQPMLNAAPPDLKILAVRVGPGKGPGGGNGPPGAQPPSRAELDKQSKDLRQQATQEFNAKKQGKGGQSINDAAALEQCDELLFVSRDEMRANKDRRVASVREGQSVTHHLNTKLSVPSRLNDEQVIEVAKINLEPEYCYKAVPVLTRHVYRLANLTNKSKLVLLPGEATMYMGKDFVGRMDLPLVAIGEEFTAGFGVDPQVQVQRDMIDTSKELKGGNQVLKYEYRILVSSFKDQPVKVQLWDRLPHPENDTVGVSIVKTTPDISADALYVREQKPNNLLRWDLKLEPTMNGEKALAVKYEFKLEMERNLSIGSFSSK